LHMLDRLLDGVSSEGLELDRVVLLGFFQGARLGLEYAARHARRYGGLVFKRRPYRPGRHATRLRRSVRWHFCLSRMQRHRSTYSARQGA
jgi:pimeloyl-ACP methyl ester carboxylesterase